MNEINSGLPLHKTHFQTICFSTSSIFLHVDILQCSHLDYKVFCNHLNVVLSFNVKSAKR